MDKSEGSRAPVASTTGTRGRVRRRTVYVGSVVAIVALVGGFALASMAFASFSNPSNQNGFTTTLGNTIWGTAANTPTQTLQSGQIATATTTTCTQASPAALTASTPENLYISGTTSGNCVAGTSGNFAEEVTFTLTAPAACSGNCPAGTDEFSVYYSQTVSSSTSTPLGQVWVSIASSTASQTFTVNVLIDSGQVPGTSVTVNDVTVVVTGA